MNEGLKRKIQEDTEFLHKILNGNSLPIVYGVTYFGDSYTMGCIEDYASIGDKFISLDGEEFVLESYHLYDHDIHKWIVYLETKKEQEN